MLSGNALAKTMAESGQGRFAWCTSMLGKKATLRMLQRLLGKRRASAVRTTEFSQGRTSRWGIAWTFRRLPAILPQASLRGSTAQSTAPARFVGQEERHS